MENFWHQDHESGRKIAADHGSPPKFKENVTVSNYQEKTKEDRAERFYLLLDENIKLKTHQAVLDGELTKMNTRLQRIKEMIARERKLNGQSFGKGFDKQIDEIIDENTELNEENRKLKAIIKGLKNRLADKTRSEYTKPSTVGRKRMVTTQFNRSANKSKTRGAGKIGGAPRPQTVGFAKPLTQDLGDVSSIKDKDLIIAKMKESISTGSITIHTLQNELEKRRSEEVKLKNLVHDLRDQLDDRDKQVQKYEIDTKDIKSKDLKIVEELNKKNAEVHALKAQVAIYESNQGNAKENRKYIQEIIQERDDYQNKLTVLLTDPFFRRESASEFFKKISDLEEQNKKLNKQLEELKEESKSKEGELSKLKLDYNSALDEKQHNAAQKGVHPFKMVGDTVDLGEMKKALMSMDPSVFRATMDRLNYDGDEPIWAKIDFLEQIGIDLNADSRDPKSAARVIELMKQDKRELAAALEKAQQILKLQYDIEKENKIYYEAESQELNTRIRELTLKLEEARKIADSRLEEIVLLKKSGQILKAEVGADYEKIDAAESEFSYATLETDLKHDENILDLAIDKAEYYNNSLLQVVESDIVSEKGFLTFFTVEFYDHDVKATDVTSGLDPRYSTLFSFKNVIDDFYIQFLQTNRIKLELFINKSQKVKKIGFANIALRELIERDYDTAHGMKSPIINGIININSSANPSLRIGSINYKMRMRKSLNEALRWFKEKSDLNTVQRSKKVTQKYLNTKIIAINVIRCIDLKSRYATHQSKIRPFFFYNFYTFDEYISKSLEGPNPEFNDLKTYSTEIDSRFKDYTEDKTFEISVIDDSVNVGIDAKSDDTIDDMIGIAHIPLFDIAKGKGFLNKFAIKNYIGDITGEIEVKITVHNSMEDINMPFNQQADLSADEWGKDFLFKIWYRYVDKGDFDLNILFSIFSKGQDAISKQAFKDSIVPKKWGVTDSEIDMFMKDWEPFERRGYMTRDEFMSIMKIPFKRAQQEYLIRSKEVKPMHDSDDDDLRRATNQTNLRKEEVKKSQKDIKKIPEETKKSARSVSKRDFSRIPALKDKIKAFLLTNKISLPVFYEYIDKDGDKRLVLDEFKNKFKMIDIDFTDDEITNLFEYCDDNGSGEVTYKEFAIQLIDINIQYTFTKIAGIIKDTLSTVKDTFSSFDKGNKGYLVKEEFSELIDEYCGKIEPFTLDLMFKYFDKSNNEKIILKEFEDGFKF